MTPDGLITSEFDDTAIVDEEELSDVELADLELVVLDLAGTTVLDDRLARRAAERAAEVAGITGSAEALVRALDDARDTTGPGAMAVFRAFTRDEDQAQHAAAAFESAYAEFAAIDGVQAVPGAERLIRRLREDGVKVVLTSGSSRAAQAAVLDALGWRDLADLTLSAAEAGRGRPYPDLPLTALLRTGATTVEGMVVVGDTAGDIASGLAAGAGLVVGVLTGAHDEQTLTDAGADAVIESVAELAALLGLDDLEDDDARDDRLDEELDELGELDVDDEEQDGGDDADQDDLDDADQVDADDADQDDLDDADQVDAEQDDDDSGDKSRTVFAASTSTGSEPEGPSAR